MEWGHKPSFHVEMEQKPSSLLSFFGRRALAPRPLSDATDFYDLDDAQESDESSPMSLEPLDDDSQTTISSPDEVSTPNTGGLGEYEFHFDAKTIFGPSGPHMFRASSTELPCGLDDSFSAELLVEPQSKALPQLKLARTSIPQPELEPDQETELEPELRVFNRPFTSLNSAVAELDDFQVRAWSPSQVADWMAEAGFEPSVVEKFLIHDISGSVLLDLQFEDLKELDISSFGKRHRVMSSIQHLRNSSMISSDGSISRPPTRSPRTLQRHAQPHECHVVPDRSLSRRRGRRNVQTSDVVTPAESISIIGIEQLLPKLHKCSKGEECSMWQRQQRKIQRLEQSFAEEARKSENIPSVVGSSDALGPSAALHITAERLSTVIPRDPQENVRQFLNFQMHSSNALAPSPPPAASASFVARPNLTEHLRGLPKLTIPLERPEDVVSARPPISALRNSTQLRAQDKLQHDPYHYGGVASPVDVYRTDTPFSANDIPVTVHPIDPCGRDVSQSVPPEMRYGAGSLTPSFGNVEPIRRTLSSTPSLRRRVRRPSFNPTVAPVSENISSPTNEIHPTSSARPPVVTSESQDLLNHAGWMRKRKTTRLLRHEWADNYYALAGNQLLTMESDLLDAAAVDAIAVDDYAVHAYSVATGSKLSAAFKKSILGSGYISTSQPSFAFSLIPEAQKTRAKSFDRNNVKSHHFAVKSGSERVEWMRRLMLAKAAVRNETANIL